MGILGFSWDCGCDFSSYSMHKKSHLLTKNGLGGEEQVEGGRLKAEGGEEQVEGGRLKGERNRWKAEG